MGDTPIPSSTPPARQHARRRWLLFFLAVTALLAATLWTFDPRTTHIYPGCMFQTLTGWYCPGCGGTRACHHLLHGRWRESLHANLLAPVLVPYLFYAILAALLGWPPARWFRWTTWGLVAVMVLFGVLRNLPWAPGPWLLPRP